MPGASGPMRGMRGNVRGRGGRGGKFTCILLFCAFIKFDIYEQVFYPNLDMPLVLLVMAMEVNSFLVNITLKFSISQPYYLIYNFNFRI